MHIDAVRRVELDAELRHGFEHDAPDVGLADVVAPVAVIDRNFDALLFPVGHRLTQERDGSVEVVEVRQRVHIVDAGHENGRAEVGGDIDQPSGVVHRFFDDRAVFIDLLFVPAAERPEVQVILCIRLFERGDALFQHTDVVAAVVAVLEIMQSLLCDPLCAFDVGIRNDA